MLTLRTVLCPTDFSDVSARAETYAAALARHYDASLHLLHVDPPMPVMAPYGEIPVDARMFEEQREVAEAELVKAGERARAGGLTVETTMKGGHPAREILALADRAQADMLVIGTHGRGGVEHLLLGSVAEKIMRKAACPVLVVPPGAPGDSDALFSRILCPIDGSAASVRSVARVRSPAKSARSTWRNTAGPARSTPARCCATPCRTTCGRGAASTNGSPPASRASAFSTPPPPNAPTSS